MCSRRVRRLRSPARPLRV